MIESAANLTNRGDAPLLRVRAVAFDFGACVPGVRTSSSHSAHPLRTRSRPLVGSEVSQVSVMQAAVRSIKATGENIIVTALFAIQPFLEAVANEGMLSPDYAYIHSEGKGHALGLDACVPGVPGCQRRQLSGQLSWHVDPRTAPGWSRFRDVWHTLTPADCDGDLEAFHNPDGFQSPSGIFDTPPSDFTSFMYDAVAAMALALHASGLRGGETSATQREHVLRNLLSLNFDGATGTILFDAATGDRDPAGLTYSLENFVYDESTGEINLRQVRVQANQPIGNRPRQSTNRQTNRQSTNHEIDLRQVRVSNGSSVQTVGDIQWIGSSTVQPIDFLLVDDINSSALSTGALLAIALPISLFALLAIRLWFIFNGRNKVFLLKNTLAPPKLAFSSDQQRWHLFLSHT